MNAERPRPRAFRLDDSGKVVLDEATPARAAPVVEEAPDPYEREAELALTAGDQSEQAVEVAQKQGVAARALFSWGGLFWSATGALVSIGLTLWLTQFIEGLFARNPALGTIGLILLGLALLALLAMAGRELFAVSRQRAIAELHMNLAKAREADDRDAARRLVIELTGLYDKRPDMARARGHLNDLTREIVDGRDLVDIAERALMTPLDEAARREIANASKRVSVVTAISPRALLDVLFVIAQAVRLMRRIAEIYGGRPGLFGLIKLIRSVGAHIAITGGMAVGDSLLQQILGHGVAAKLSARLGEGVLNGLLTARVGLSAMAVCRPMPFAATPAPGVKDVAPFLFGEKGKD